MLPYSHSYSCQSITHRRHQVARQLRHAGVTALAFSPDGCSLAAYAHDVPAVFLWALVQPWSAKMLFGAGGGGAAGAAAQRRDALVLQPCSCWLLTPRQQQAQPGGRQQQQGGLGGQREQQQLGGQQEGKGLSVDERGAAVTAKVPKGYAIRWSGAVIEVLSSETAVYRLQA